MVPKALFGSRASDIGTHAYHLPGASSSRRATTGIIGVDNQTPLEAPVTTDTPLTRYSATNGARDQAPNRRTAHLTDTARPS
jgi:hypothetical protein